VARTLAADERLEGVADEPFAPSAAVAPIFAAGYRELWADLFFVRLTGYFGSGESTAQGIGGLVDAIVALDPQFYRVYEYGARSMTLAKYGVDQQTFQRAIAVLERAMAQFPDDWKFPYLAGQIYTQDLATKDAVQRRAWDEKGTLLIESAVRKPGAPAEAAEWAAVMRTRFGQHERAIQNLREIITVTTDAKARKALLERLAELQHSDANELAAELFEQKHKLEDAWKRDRPTIPTTMYVLLGPRLQPGFDMGDLATGGRNIVGSEAFEKLEPLVEEAPAGSGSNTALPRSP
jgi:tetratricopeptide (TPR) repeat protein